MVLRANGNREVKAQVGKMNDEPTPESIQWFCVLEYIASEGYEGPVDDPKIIALVTASEDNEARIYVHPEWERMVQLHDREYLGSLYRDFKSRIKSDPDTLFRQLSELAVGPLVARGSDLSEFPAYRSLMSWFQEL